MDFKVFFGLLFCVVLIWAEENQSASQVAAGDDSDMYMEPLETDHDTSSSDAQEQQAESGQWFPSFSRSYEPFEHQPSGHSRPVDYNYQQQEGAYSQRNEPPFQQDVSYKDQQKFSNGFSNNFGKDYQQAPQQAAANDKSASLLGDGNFGVIQGGTFYPDKDGYDSESSGFDDFSSYFYNGHGRPSYFYPSNPKPGKQQQFENFRDFADINSPPERQYSQYVVVYTNKNGTRTITTQEQQKQPLSSSEQLPEQEIQIDVKRPKNILESLALLDHSDTKNDKTLVLPIYDQGDVIELPPEKKGSKSKKKLAKLLPEKKHEARLLEKARDMREPLLALS